MQRLFILAEPRSGSSWLMETLNSFKEITLLTELYNHQMFEEAAAFQQLKKEHFPGCIDYLEKKLTINNKYTGCKILLNQMEWISGDFAGYFVERYKNAYFILLLRQNMIEAQVSLRIAHTTNVWHIKKKEHIKRRKIHLNVNHLYQNLEKTRLLREKVLNHLGQAGVKKIGITYEELFKNRKKSIKDLCDFLNLAARRITFSSEKKGNPFKPEEVVENFAEVKQFLKQYPHYYKMLG